MDYKKKAKAQLLQQMRANGGTLIVTIAGTNATVLRYLQQMVDAGQIEEAEHNAGQVTYKLPTKDQRA